MPVPVITSTALPVSLPRSRGRCEISTTSAILSLIAATDRLSAFDVVLPTGIPNKGKVLTRQRVLVLAPLLRRRQSCESVDVKRLPEALQLHPEIFAGRSMLVRKTKPLPVECIVRGISLRERLETTIPVSPGTICGISLPTGLKESDILPQPILHADHEGRGRRP